FLSLFLSPSLYHSASHSLFIMFNIYLSSLSLYSCSVFQPPVALPPSLALTVCITAGTHSHSPSLSVSLSLPLSRSLPPNLSFSLSHSLSLFFSLALSFFLFLFLSLSPPFFLFLFCLFFSFF